MRPVQAGRLGGQGHRQRAPDRPDLAVQAELAEHHPALQRFDGELPRRAEDAQRDRQVERRAFLAYVGRREVHGDAGERERVPGVLDRRVDALAALLHGPVRQPHGGEAGQAAGDIGFDIDQLGVDPEHRGGRDAGEHI